MFASRAAAGVAAWVLAIITRQAAYGMGLSVYVHAKGKSRHTLTKSSINATVGEEVTFCFPSTNLLLDENVSSLVIMYTPFPHSSADSLKRDMDAFRGGSHDVTFGERSKWAFGQERTLAWYKANLNKTGVNYTVSDVLLWTTGVDGSLYGNLITRYPSLMYGMEYLGGGCFSLPDPTVDDGGSYVVLVRMENGTDYAHEIKVYMTMATPEVFLNAELSHPSEDVCVIRITCSATGLSGDTVMALTDTITTQTMHLTAHHMHNSRERMYLHTVTTQFSTDAMSMSARTQTTRSDIDTDDELQIMKFWCHVRTGTKHVTKELDPLGMCYEAFNMERSTHAPTTRSPGKTPTHAPPTKPRPTTTPTTKPGKTPTSTAPAGTTPATPEHHFPTAVVVCVLVLLIATVVVVVCVLPHYRHRITAALSAAFQALWGRVLALAHRAHQHVRLHYDPRDDEEQLVEDGADK